jgi:hypothetical protein
VQDFYRKFLICLCVISLELQASMHDDENRNLCFPIKSLLEAQKASVDEQSEVLQFLIDSSAENQRKRKKNRWKNFFSCFFLCRSKKDLFEGVNESFDVTEDSIMVPLKIFNEAELEKASFVEPEDDFSSSDTVSNVLQESSKASFQNVRSTTPYHE